MSLDLNAVSERADRATKGPWHVEYFGDRGYPQRIGNDAAIIVADTHWGGGGLAPDAEFIAHAREDVPALVAEIRRLRSVVEAAQTWRRWFPFPNSMFVPEDALIAAVDAHRLSERECPAPPVTDGIRDDGGHCDHWLDGGPCCRCQAPAEPSGTEAGQ